MSLKLNSIVFHAFRIAVLPIQLLAFCAWFLRLQLICIPNRISRTAHIPLLYRLLFHYAGTRPDPVSAGCAPHCPGFDSMIVWMFSIVATAAKLLNVQDIFFAFPPPPPPSTNRHFNVRTSVVDQEFKKFVHGEGKRQIVLLGSGYDFRSWEASCISIIKNDPNIVIFDVDTPETQASKITALLKAGYPTDIVSFVKCGFGQEDWLDCLKLFHFDVSVPTLFVWEGVTPYLPGETVAATLRTISQLSAGTRIVMDIYSEEFVKSRAPFENAGKWLRWILKVCFGEEFIFGLPTIDNAEDNLKFWLSDQNLSCVHLEWRFKNTGFMVVAEN